MGNPPFDIVVADWMPENQVLLVPSDIPYEVKLQGTESMEKWLKETSMLIKNVSTDKEDEDVCEQ